MGRAMHIVGIVFSVVFLFVAAFYANEVQDARFSAIFSDYYEYSSYGSYSLFDNSDELSQNGALWSLFFFLCFIAVDIISLIKIKTTTKKVFAIIGLSISGLLMFWNFVVLADPGGVSYDEVAPVYVIYCMMMLAFMIVGLVQSVRYHKRITGKAVVPAREDSRDLLDS